MRLIADNRMIKKQLFLSLFIVINVIQIPMGYADSEKLISIQQWIESEFPDVEHISQDTYINELKDSEEVVIFDVREKSEYAVSHLQNAIQIDPDINANEFNALFGEKLAGKQAIFYCSVGRRSSVLANKVSDGLLQSGTTNVFNLEYGIFGWHDKSLPLVNKHADTEYVHPYSWRWKRYLQNKELTKYD